MNKNTIRTEKGNGDKIIVSFNGWDPEFFDGKFLEWGNLLREYYSTLICFYDTEHRWYLDDYWKSLIYDTLDQYERIDFSIGLSMGGWGSLYHQDVVKAKSIRAFGPQSFVNAAQWRNIGDYHRQWSTDIDQEIFVKIENVSCDDVRIIYGMYHEDDIHYTNYKELDFNVRRVEAGTHRIVGNLKKDGILIPFLFH